MWVPDFLTCLRPRTGDDASAYKSPALPFPSATPVPHAEHRLLRQGVAHLAGEHRDLATMVWVVGDHLAEESGYVRAEALSPATARKSRFQDRAESCLALHERLHMCWRPPTEIPLVANLAGLGCRLQPAHAQVIEVSSDGSDGPPPLESRRPSAPGFGGQVFDHVVVDAVVWVETAEQGFGW
jgi:hypothetical protein